MDEQLPELRRATLLMAKKIQQSSAISSEDRGILILNTALTLMENLMPDDVDLADGHDLLGKLREARDRELEGRNKRKPRREIERRCFAVAAVRYFSSNGDQHGIREARKRVARILQLDPDPNKGADLLKRWEVQWLKNKSAANGLQGEPISRGSLVLEQLIGQCLLHIEGAEKLGCDVEVFIKEYYDSP
ncbi:hypothetical protein [Ruegeria arenilitoris]|uniref:hypothetical protein n=1 Tax=Ruegeria arenilitoris TaxID=1173585 RepID=UPI001481499C|nr:hypothetical protein [Ruegeria arenilitoris]